MVVFKDLYYFFFSSIAHLAQERKEAEARLKKQEYEEEMEAVSSADVSFSCLKWTISDTFLLALQCKFLQKIKDYVWLWLLLLIILFEIWYLRNILKSLKGEGYQRIIGI